MILGDACGAGGKVVVHPSKVVQGVVNSFAERHSSTRFGDRACCIVLKMLRDPGSANAMDPSSPRMECHFLTLVRRWVGEMEARISARRSTRWGGSWMVMLMVSMIQPKMSFSVPQEQSPSCSFLIDKGSRRVGLSVGKSGWKTSSMECKRALRTRRRLSRSWRM